MKSGLRPVILCSLLFVSGAAGLADQLVWVRLFAAGLGHEVPSVIGVAGAFLGGLALGAGAFAKWGPAGPIQGARWYGGLEILIGIWVAASGLFLPRLNEVVLRLVGPEPASAWHWTVVFGAPLLSLLPATAAMGATLPALERCWATHRGDGRCVGAMYASNTIGAVSGALLGAFVIMPTFGFQRSILGLGSVSVVCGVVALRLAASHRTQSQRAARRGITTPRHSSPAPGPASSRLRQDVTMFITGFLGLGFQWVAVRILAQVLENTLYSYAAALAVYLGATASGAALYQRFGARWPHTGTTVGLLAGVAVACLWGVEASPVLRGVYDFMRGLLGDGIRAVLLSEMTVGTVVLGLAAMLMGGLFSHLVQGSATAPGGVGRAMAWNTLGCAAGTLVVSVILLPVLGVRWTVAVLAAGYLALLPKLRGNTWAGLGLAVGSALFLPVRPETVDRPEGAEVMVFREGALASVAVIKNRDGHRSLRVNNRLQMGGTAAALAERRQAWLPLLLHPAPRRALCLGPGTGITLGAMSHYPGLNIDAVELVPEVIDVMRAFAPENAGALDNPAVRLHVADARRFVRTTSRRYDVIIADLFHPAQDGAGFLYTREHFEAVRGCLAPGGLFCQWLPLHQLDPDGLRVIVRTFIEVYPQACAVLLHFNVDIPVLGLIALEHGTPSWGQAFEDRVRSGPLRELLRGVGLERPIQGLGCLAAAPITLREYARGAALSVDDLPQILFAGPRHTTRRDIRTHGTLMDFLGAVKGGEADWAAAGLGLGREVSATALRDFIAARDLYLQGLVDEGAGRLTEAVELYLASARRSLLFTSGYARCVTIIQLMAGGDRVRARALYQRLQQAQPQQPLARQILGPLLDGDPPRP